MSTTSDLARIAATPCYLNGQVLPLNQAHISVMDRGFIFGDGVYEVLSVYDGQVFRFEQHMQRLDRSLAELRIANPHTRDEWHAIATGLLTHADAPVSANHLIYVQITRGVAMRDHVMPADITPTVFVMLNPMSMPTDVQRTQGVACVSAPDFRWEKAHIKSTSLLGSVFSRQISADAGAVETVMFRGEHLSEAAASNVWVVKHGVVSGPSKDNLVLEGIRYGLLEQLCKDAGIGFELRAVTQAEVLDADELLLSSATKEVLPITTLDGQPVGNGAPGPIYNELYQRYQLAKRASRI
jgi:D-alanine transaminase